MQTIEARQAVEREIAEQVIKDALAAGYVVGVYDGGEETVKGTNVDVLSAALMTTDEDWLTIYPAGDESPLGGGFERGSQTTRIGWVRLVYGNDGWDVVCDYTTNLEPIMGNATALADKYSEAV